MERILRSAGAAAVLAALALAAVPAAFAESVTSPSGMVSLSVPPPVLSGVAANYTLTVTNNDPSGLPMSNVQVFFGLPSGFSVKATGVECVRTNRPTGPALACAWASLAPGATASTTISLVAANPGAYSIPLGFVADEPVPGVPGAFSVVTDSATLNVNVAPGPTDIQVTGSSNQGSPPVGSTFTYTWQVKNNGPQGAYGVTFDDTLPAGLSLGSVSGAACTAAGNAVHCDLGTLGVGAQDVISINASPTAAGIYANTATIAMLGADTHPANDSFTVTVQAK